MAGSRPAWKVVLTAFVLLLSAVAAVAGLPAASHAATTRAVGELDCNGDSPVQHSVKANMICTDIRGFANEDNANTWGGRFYDNGVYIGHDEPDMTFYSTASGSGDNATWTETLGTDPAAAPTVQTPGSDVTHWFELTAAPWFSMAMCDPNSYPLNPCTPQSDSNAPTKSYSGGGSAFMEMQFYPPGWAPFYDAISCDNTHWCAALTIDSLECTYGFASCNNNCIEPVNFAFIQTNGVPTGPPSPQDADLATYTPNSDTLLMNPGDKIQVSMADAAVPHSRGRPTSAFEVVVKDLTTGQSGYMQASAQNGFQNTSITDCSGTPFNFQPEYNTAAQGNIVPWAALATDISTEYEIGHFEPCTSVSKPATLTLGPGETDTYYNLCQGPYETAAPGGDGSHKAEVSDAPCYMQGDTHGPLNSAPDTVTGCYEAYYQNGDLDFDGTPYWADWPTGTSATKFPASFAQSLPTTNGAQYSQFQIQTDVALSESTCPGSGSGCAVPPPNAPGSFYPYWSRVGSSCTVEFGNVTTGDLGGVSQYGSDQYASLGYPEFMGPVLPNTC
jgi:hypothetical protein